MGAPAGSPAITALPPARHLALIGVGIVAVGTSGPLIAATVAPALAIAFWRNAFGTLATAPLVVFGRSYRAELRGLTHREWRFAIFAGLLLALHFGTWVPSLDYTSVTSSIALVATQPIWAAVLARLGGHQIPGRVWLGIGIALAGVLFLTGVDTTVSGSALLGDALALLGGVFAAAYISAGAVIRQSISTATYTTVCYGVCAVALLISCIVSGADLGGYAASDWLKLVALTVGAQLLGHSVFNHVLTTTSATLVSLAILLEVPIAAVLAAIWLDQMPPVAAVPAALLLLVGIGVVVGWRASGTQPAIPAE